MSRVRRMSSGEPRTQRIRAGGRSEIVRQTVATTVLEMLRQGNSAFSVAEVAKRAGIHRSTVYRWWPTRLELIKEALTLHTARLVVPDTGSWATDIDALTRELAEFFSDPVEAAMNAVLASDRDSEVAKTQREHWAPILRDLSRVVDRAKARGEVRDDVNPRFVLEIIVGPLLLNTTFGHNEIGPTAIDAIADLVTNAFSTAGSAAGTEVGR
ncbi:TetR family transcriptional regulator [Dietzia sp. ANT_WB102]|nr:TetR family transcriptional regulator [Dietzia sp. ANT_WB102]